MNLKSIRILNFIIDGICIQTFSILFVYILTYVAAHDEPKRVIEISSNSINFYVFIVYYLSTECIFETTIGKLITRTVIVNAEGSPPSIQNLLLRTILRSLIPIDIISFLIDKNGTGFHDKYSKTKVVKR